MSTIILRKLSFGYSSPQHDVFDGLDLLIDAGWRAGLVGRNGRGKTTLLKLIARELVPQGGELTHAFATRYFPFRPEQPNAPVRDVVKNAVAPFERWERTMGSLLEDGSEQALERYGTLLAQYEALGGYSIDGRVTAALERLDIPAAFLRRAFATLSPGEQTRALIASLFVADGSYALIDEPTNHLDLVGRELLADFLAAQSGFLLVSHDRRFLDRSIDHVIALRPRGAAVVRASYSEWRELERQRVAFETKRNEGLRSEIRSLERASRARREGALARERDKAPHTDKGYIGRRAAKQMKRAIAIETRIARRIDERKQLMRDVDKRRELKLNVATANRQLIVANNLTVVRNDRALFAPLSFSISTGDRVAILGRNGAGKTSLLEALRGAALATRGVLRLSRPLVIVAAAQTPTWPSGRVDERLREAGLERERFFNVMGSLGVRGEILETPLERLSAGEQKKVELARTLITPADLLFWDEPLNAVDIESREQLERLILDAAPSLVFVEHDAHFLETIATDTITLLPASDRS